MKCFVIPVLAVLAALVVGCSSAAPTAPIGLNKHPANSADTVASLARPPADQPAEAAAPNVSLPPRPLELSQAAPVPSSPKVIILSDQTAPLGITSLSPQQRSELVAAARSAGGVRIFCRGDRSRPSMASRWLLIRRGLVIKRFLVAQGVEPGKIRLLVRSAGGFVADNSTPSGRAQNRRVEIQFV